MCNLYTSPTEQEVWDYWDVSGPMPPLRFFEGHHVGPKKQGQFLRADRATGGIVYAVGRWQLVPKNWPDIDTYPYATNNARWENKVRVSRTFKPVWLAGQRCVIPVRSFYEPCYETGSHVSWRFENNDGNPLGLAGLWNSWIDQSTGQVLDTYTMITINADDHPIMKRMHKPDPDDPEKRMVAVLTPQDQQAWLFGSPAEAEQLIEQWPVVKIKATPMHKPKPPSAVVPDAQGDLF
ncbi:SOS response-associated peptidase family protein [Rhizobacter sp. Root16D2]|uniref:SOS response-associated peptidase family protein n=1 Tax=Rhizobacter sp. Root16D2 TaxID=1736479 RepID=UPI0009EA1EDA|nr:SOS response-associated peptidase family protein [Rhizobacter sp. Root16D2]